MNSLSLTKRAYNKALDILRSQDADLASVLKKWGVPPFWVHPPGFPGLILAILGQQVSIESANATFEKLENKLKVLTPESILQLDDHALREIGFSRQKASYVRGIAHELIGGSLDLESLRSSSDDQVRERLLVLRGIGPWTADTYLLFALRRADAWPSRDLALAKAIEEVMGLETTPDWDRTDEIADSWRPFRAVAARILWHHYLCVRGRGSTHL